MIDWTKPVRTVRLHLPVRILCIDAGTLAPVVGVVGDVDKGLVARWDLEGRGAYSAQAALENVPPEPVSKTFELVMHRCRRNGIVNVGKHEPGWQPHENEVLARKLVTITEGDGL